MFRSLLHLRQLALTAGLLLAAAAVGTLGAHSTIVRPAPKPFHLTYTTHPLDAQGQVDRDQSPTTHYYKDQRSRIDSFTVESGRPVLASSFIMDCDSSRMIQVSWAERRYTLMTFAEWKHMMEQSMQLVAQFSDRMPGHPAPRAGAAGGVVTTTTSWTDTTASRDWFGLQGRYIANAQTTVSSAEACYAVDTVVENRWWVTDLDLPLCLPPMDLTTPGLMMPPPATEGCTDRHDDTLIGTPRPLGFVLRQETSEILTGRRIVTGFEVTALSREPLADSLFAPPTGFERVSMEDVFSMGTPGAEAAAPAASPKAAGIVRIGIALDMPPDAPAERVAVADDVVAWINSQTGYDAVRLAARERAAALAEAPAADADYVLVYAIAKAKPKVSGRGLLGGIVAGAVGARAAGGTVKLEIEGDYVLLRLSGERVAGDDIETEESADDPQAALAKPLTAAAQAALRALAAGS